VFEFLGFGMGPMVTGVIRDVAGFDAVFLTMAGMMSLSGLIVLAFLPWRIAPVPTSGDGDGGDGDGEEAARRLVSWGELLGDRYFQALFAQRTGWSFAFGSAFSFLAVYLEEEIGATATMVGFVLAGQELLGGLLQPVFGPLADRFNRRALVFIGTTVVASGYAVTAFADSYWVILLAFVGGAGVGSALSMVSSMAMQVDVGRRVGMATVMSFTGTAFAAGVLGGSVFAGLVADRVGTESVFLAAAAAILLGAVFFVVRTAGAPSEVVGTAAEDVVAG